MQIKVYMILRQHAENRKRKSKAYLLVAPQPAESLMSPGWPPRSRSYWPTVIQTSVLASIQNTSQPSAISLPVNKFKTFHWLRKSNRGAVMHCILNRKCLRIYFRLENLTMNLVIIFSDLHSDHCCSLISSCHFSTEHISFCFPVWSRADQHTGVP